MHLDTVSEAKHAELSQIRLNSLSPASFRSNRTTNLRSASSQRKCLF
jgi:hypothetical protein